MIHRRSRDSEELPSLQFFESGDTIPVQAEGEATPTPNRIGTYEVIDRLGEGGMGIVYKAVQSSPRRTVALKLVRLATASAEGYQRFQREAEFLGRLEHPRAERPTRMTPQSPTWPSAVVRNWRTT